jgi:Tfp pilus assembly protein PilE
MQQALAIRVVVLSVLTLAAGAGATSYLGSHGKAQDNAALTHVRAAVHAAESWYQDPYGGHGSYRTLDPAALVQEAPNVSSKVHVTALAGGKAFCLDDEEAAGHSAYYLGGDVASVDNLNGATPFTATLVHSTVDDAAAVCANAS